MIALFGTVETVMDQVPIRRALTEDNLMAWLNIYIVAKIANVQLSNKKDVFN